ncbi:MAG: hypothetical protein C4547_12350 [Phycisphaerales bacterium]|nr:MAG: hypothetical protein C4547_12350 [Phycisphaerales bacterium]
MPTFAIHHGATALCRWELPGGAATFHPRVERVGDLLVLQESEWVGFALNPPAEGQTYRIFIGDVPLRDLVSATEEAAGVTVPGPLRWWAERPYFESARGHTRIILESRAADGTDDEWTTLLSAMICVLPSKLGEERYQCMARDMEKLNRGLLLDLYGKSRRTEDLRLSREGRAYHSRDEEVTAIEGVLERLGELLSIIACRPASGVRSTPQHQNYWGHERLAPQAIVALSQRGVAPSGVERPLRTRTWRRVESFDIPEHRVIRAFLDVLMKRGAYCARAAREHIRAITAERGLRDVRFGDGPTIYESVDEPRIARLLDAVRRADRSVARAAALAALPFLQDAAARFVPIRGGAFQRSAAYRTTLDVIRRFLIEHAFAYEGEELLAVTKLTSRLFEQWCYFQIVEAFRGCGLELREWTDALRDSLRSRFIVDLDRGVTFEGTIAQELRLRFRYEPWILGRRSAEQMGETLCRGGETDVAWCPDVVIECMRRERGDWRPVYAIVLDCKYTATLTAQHWSDTSKYLEIRCTRNLRQVVKQLWLIAPASRGGIVSEDPAVQFEEGGPSCGRHEAVRFRLLAAPGASPEWGDGDNVFARLATGTIRFLIREFGAAGAE